MGDTPASHLPRPFYNEWSSRLRPAVHALWDWHSALTEPSVGAQQPVGEEVDRFFDEERRRVEAGDPIRLVSDSVWTNAYEACEKHGLDRDLLGAQVEAARKFVQSEVRFETDAELKTFVRLWAVPHGRLLAALADADYSTQLRRADELARGFFHLGRIVTLPRDVARDRLFVPQERLRQSEVTVEQLRTGSVDEGMRRLLWKESVRVRDALAQGRPLIDDLSFRQGYALKWYWVGARALLDELERRDFDLWSEPLDLPLRRRLYVYLKTIFGRTGLR